MSPIAWVFVLAGAVFAALYNVESKKVQTGHWKERSRALVFFHSGGAAVLLLLTSLASGGPQVQSGWLWPIVASGVLNVGIQFAKMRARSLEDVSLVSPIDSTTPAIVIFTSMVMLGEFPSTWGWLGIWLMVVGTYILNIEEAWKKLAEIVASRKQESVQAVRWFEVYSAPFLALGKSVGVRWAFFACALSSISLNYDGLVARRTDIGFGFGCVFAIAAIGNGIWAWQRREFDGIDIRQALKESRNLIVTLMLTNYITNWAFRHSIVPYVGTLKRLQIPLTIILAAWLLGESKNLKDRLVGGTLMAIGAVLIALGGKP